jgi:copper chaperone NosL
MSKLSRLLLAFASGLLLLALALPLWRVQLVAPQYPEGLGMEIRANTVRGATEHDLGSINNLNHYIGMKAIEPDEIPDLRVIPWVFGGLALFGAVAAAAGRRRLAIAWLAVFVIAGAVGLWDFYRWEYSYGHDLDLQHAIIKVPGMSYQPPLIGSKQLLNFVATSWPASGSVIVAAAFLLGVTALVLRAPRQSIAHRRLEHAA